MTVHPLLLVATLEVAVLLLASGALALALWRHSEHILYPEGVAYYGTALFVFTLAAVVDLAGEATGQWPLDLAGELLFTLASAVATAAGWHFARDFLSFDREGREVATDDGESGGFEDA